MDRLAFNAVVAINEQRTARQMTTNELANVSTPGFKRSFEAAMQAVKVEGPGFQSRMQPQMFTSDYINMKPGTPMSTGRDLDVSFNDQTVLGVTGQDGKLAFTRRGDLRVNAAGALETGSGHLVQGQGGGGITIPPGLLVTVSPDGSVFASDPSTVGVTSSVAVGKLLMRDASKTNLERNEGGLFRVVGAPGQDITAGTVPPSLTSRSLEGSNVNAMEVMVKLMAQSRSFVQHVNLIKESKQIDESGASMMKSS
jgi:flagellar basal-body rod protein FlgF